VFSIAIPVFAQDDASSAPEQNHLVIATTDNGPISVDRLLFTALRNIHNTVDFVTPIVREGYSQANEGIVDGVIAGYPNLHTVYEDLRQVPVTLERINVRVFAREGSNLQINSWDELSGLHVGILENRTYILERLPESVTITENPNNRAALDALVHGEFDVAVLVERDHETLGERLSITRVGDVDLLTEFLYLNKKHETLIPYLAAELERLFADGNADRILNDIPSGDPNQRRTIVHILSTSIELDREDRFIAELREQFEGDMSLDWMTVNIDARRFSRGQFGMANIASLLRADLVSKNVAAVIVSGDTALEFLKDYYYLYFRNVPVLFYGVSERYSEIIQDSEHHYHFTGIVKNIEAYRMLEVALSFFPDTKNVLVVNDYTAEGTQYRAAMERSLEPFNERLNIEYNENLDANALLEKINRLPEDSLLMVGSYFVDANHQYYTLSESKRLLERNCNVPIISFYSAVVEYNAVGGKQLDYTAYGDEIASMLKNLLEGYSAEDIPIMSDSSSLNRWVFDQIQMDAFGVAESDLPEGSDIINRNLSIREANPQFFMAMIILSIVSTLLIIGVCVFLSFNHRHNKQKDVLQQELTIEKSMLETIFDSVPEMLFVKDLNHVFIRVNKQFKEFFDIIEEDIVGTKGYENNLLAAIVNDFMETEKAVVRENRLIMTERSIKGADDLSPFFEVIATPLRNKGKTVGIVGVAYDITHRKEMEDAAQAASRAKSNFLANMSHEMRTPLTAVLGLTELTLETVQLDDETHSNLIKVYRSGETILNLVNDILDISKIEADRLALNPLKYDLPSLINDTINQSVLYMDEKPIELVLDISGDLPNYLYGDELRIKQILNNLLSNSFKFTKEGTVELGLKCERDEDIIWMTAWVRDTGIGIRPDDMDKLFTLYAKMEEENSRGVKANRRTEGTGLGLSISKKVAEMMDGSITVESEYGEGSTFTLKIKQGYVNDDVIGDEVVESLKKFDYSLHRFEYAKMTRINLSYARVLIADDNPTNLDVAKGLMGLYGMTIDCVPGGQEAVDAIRNETYTYDAIFMDHMMPEIDGVEATRMIREEIDTKYAREIPVIALTANAIVGNEEMFLSKGFQAFIAKPIDLSRLDVVLRQWVRNKEAEALLPDKIINIGARREKERQLLRDDIPGLDMDKGIAHFGYSEDAYFKVLQSYVKNTRPLLDVIRGVNRDNLNMYGVTIHGIKGSSRGIFAKKTGDAAEALESAAIAGNYDFIEINNAKFLEMIIQLLTHIENAITKSGMEQKPVKDKPDDALLKKLLSACKDFDIDEIDTLMAALDSYEYKEDDGLVTWLRENLDQGKYRNVKDRLSKHIESMEG